MPISQLRHMPWIVENFDVKRAALDFEGGNFPDSDEDRVHVYDTMAWRIILYATMGPALDPYTAFNFALAVDRVASLIPTSGWIRNALRVATTVHSKSPFRNSGPLSQSQAVFYDRDSANIEESMVETGKILCEKFRSALTRELPATSTMEPRIIVANVIPLSLPKFKIPKPQKPPQS